MKPARGFTLVELLVVLVLLSLVVLAMASALRTASQTEERVDERLQSIDELRTTNGFLRSVLGQVSAQKKTGVTPAGSSPFFFTGSPAAMSWIGVMPARYGAGGRYHFRMFVTDAGALTLQYLPWHDAATLPDWSVAPASVLLEGVTGLALQYEDAAGEPTSWSPDWTLTDRLPDRVSITVQTQAGNWPAMVIALRVLPGTDPRARRAIFGGSVG